tara:strand:+ start:27 stop:470 length:444 start_codon:yes stop_codon:yes gene_type:complete
VNKNIPIKAEIGHTVRVHYSGRLEDGTEFDASVDGSPLELTIGEGDSLPGFENALIGMSPGDTKTIRIHPDDAHGQYFSDLVRTVDRTQVPRAGELEVGARISATLVGGQRAFMKILDISDERVTVDLNHPLAGKKLIYKISMIEFS